MSPTLQAMGLALLGDALAAPAGNGYQSEKVRLPRWAPTYNMKRSTLFMPCNYSGWHNVDEALQYGLVSYDWANAQALWSRDSPMDSEGRLVTQADKAIAANRTTGGTRVGVYRNAIKAFNWFGPIIQEKLDDPAYAGWFIQFKDCKDPRSNHSYDPPACTGDKCSCAWHDHAGQLPGGTQNCGKSPCGGYVFDHRNASFSKWFFDEFVISNDTILHKGISELYLDDRVELWGIAEAQGHFLRDTGLSQKDMQALKDAFDSNMEALYDKVIDLGAFAWQMLYDGPNVVPWYFPNGTINPKGLKKPEVCAQELRFFCQPNSSAARRALAYTQNPSVDNATFQADQYLANFLLTRGDYAWIGYDYRGCKSTPYPRPAEWDVDYGEPIGTCAETGNHSMVFWRQWSKATVHWDCKVGKGGIDTKKQPPVQLVVL
mmetsp:Transcript_69836/g.161558  ORF Transcript_69836/g.161558 Transcript_69836/m.161558 type:complete len:431 (+) Transcript_69836:51-1343(+)